MLVVSASISGRRGRGERRRRRRRPRRGRERILYTSHQAASADSLFGPQPTHAATEQHLAGQGVPFTALRNGFYTSTLGYYPGARWRPAGSRAGGRPGVVDRARDLAEAAAIAL